MVRFDILGDHDAEWTQLLERVKQARPTQRARFVLLCNERSLEQPDALRVFAGVEYWLEKDGRWGLVDTYAERLAVGSEVWSMERAACTAAALLEREVYARGIPLVDARSRDVVAGFFGLVWGDLVEACGYPRELAMVVFGLSESSLTLDEILITALRAAS